MKSLSIFLLAVLYLNLAGLASSDPDKKAGKTIKRLDHDDKYPIYVPMQGYFSFVPNDYYFTFSMIIAEGDKVFFEDKNIRKPKGTKQVTVHISKADSACAIGIPIEKWLNTFDSTAAAPQYLSLPDNKVLVTLIAKFDVKDDEGAKKGKREKGIRFDLDCHPGHTIIQDNKEKFMRHISGSVGHPK